ncbi:hypothetical protein ACEQ8H_002712 [Pleosporales sp. CAS-2024a]
MVLAPIIRGINRGISTGIGLAGEKYHDHKERKIALAQQEEKSRDTQTTELVNPVDPGSETTSDEQIWALDDVSDPPNHETLEAQHRPGADRTISDLVHSVVAARDAHEQVIEAPTISLPYPVIIPQRRPGSKARGWVRAYPPDLDAVGVDQGTFLQFLQNFEDAQEASPWLKALYVAGNAVGFVPGHITFAVSICISVAAGTAIELQGRYKANNFLDQMNKDFFMPLGLYAMVIICKDTASKDGEVEFGMESVNMETAKQISKWGLPKNEGDDHVDESTKTKMLRPIRLASGRTNADHMPLEIAPLIYPHLEDLVERPQVTRDESFKQRLMRNKGFVAEYFDRRARAEYAGNNPDSALTKASGSMPEFSNRFADPNHAVNNGHLFSLITGGNWVGQPLGKRLKLRENGLREKGPDGKLLPAVKQEHQIRGPISLVTHPIRKVMSANVLYLTVVNLPSENDLAEAKAALQMDQKGWKDMLAAYTQGRTC